MNKFKSFLKKFFFINDAPYKVAAGAALGIFLGIVPGEGLLTTLVLASFFRFNRLSATAGVMFCNMWSTIVVLPLAAGIGGFIFHISAKDLINNFQITYDSGIRFFFSQLIFLDILLPLLLGFIIIAGAIALVFYFLIYFLLKYKKIEFK